MELEPITAFISVGCMIALVIMTVYREVKNKAEK